MKDPLIALHDKAAYKMFCDLHDNPLLSLTELSENAAISLDHDEWLDDDCHWIWELAIEVREANGITI